MELVPKSELEARAAHLKRWMQGAEIDAVFILQNADVFYFTGTVQVGLFCIPVSGEPIFLVQKSASRARLESAWDRIIPLSSLKKAPDILTGEGVQSMRRIGLEMDVLPTSYYLRFQALFPAVQFIDATEGIRNTRMIKSPYEVDQMRRSAEQLQRSFTEMPNWMKAGITELEVSARLESCLRQLGHQGITRMRGFNNEIAYGTVSSGSSACYPTLFPGPVGFVGLYPGIPNGASLRKLAPRDPLMADIVGGYGGYIADKTRVFVLGELSPDMHKAQSFVLDLMREVESLLRPGTPCSAIYRHTLQRVEDSPYAANFMGVGDSQVRFVGHGVGLELDEWPVLAKGFDLELEAGMTIAVEPKIFFPERGGVGIEDTYLITSGGFERLTHFQEDVTIVPA